MAMQSLGRIDPLDHPITQSQTNQRLASDATVSAWVAASAGSGKTKVLTDRILNLLLAGFDPDRIVCLTFTKAAAAEMANRLYFRLSRWALLTDDLLQTELNALRGNIACAETLKRARLLFTMVLDTPGGMKILTIHGFCQSILARFPLEAQVSPHFTILDDIQANDLLHQARDYVLSSRPFKGETDTTRKHEIQKALAVLTEHMADQTFNKILYDMNHQRRSFEQVLQKYPTRHARESYLKGVFNLPDTIDLNEKDLISVILDHHYTLCHEHRQALLALLAVQDNLSPSHKILAAWLSEPQMRSIIYPDYKRLYLTISDEISRRPQIKYMPEAENIYALQQLIKQACMAQKTTAMLTLTAAILEKYQELKLRQSALDYDDLIDYTQQLLVQPGIASWVLFKLDGGIDHLLIDEAQDTNPRQWQVIRALTADFFTPDKPYRTIFAVGDAKQSIYSFQGARPEEFLRLKGVFAQDCRRIQQKWRDIGLDMSFRSTPEILHVVDKVFQNPYHRQGVCFDPSPLIHHPFRSQDHGEVELWPLILKDATEKTAAAESWIIPTQLDKTTTPAQKTARFIAQKIRGWFDEKHVLPSTRAVIQPKDILILIRKRSAFVEDLIRALKSENIPVAGTDRLQLTQHIAVIDLMALGQFLLLPEDDYSLACVLKSPLIGWHEEDLFSLCQKNRIEENIEEDTSAIRTEMSDPIKSRTGHLWVSLIHRQHENPAFQKAYDFLSPLLGKADYMRPYDFYSFILSVQKGRSLFIGRLGLEAEDPLDEFLNQALVFERLNPPTLQGFIHFLQQQDLEIKRDSADSQRNEVRIMTIHGSKGLQAPIVILPEHLDGQNQRDFLLWQPCTQGDAVDFVFIRPSADEDTPFTKSLKAIQAQKAADEDRRLLYVALTRPQDRLYVCGWCTRKQPEELPHNTWYGIVKEALESLGAELLSNGQLRYRTGVSAVAPTAALLPFDGEITLPEWAITPLESTTVLTTASCLELETGKERPSSAPLTAAAKRGVMIHALFEILPDFPEKDRMNIGLRFIRQQSMTSAASLADLKKTIAIMEMPLYASLFGHESQAEIEIAVDDALGGMTLGRIDRIRITDTVIQILDFKTTPNPPHCVEDVDLSYIAQLNRYKTALQKIYPHHQYETYILWTHGPYLMRIE